MAVWSCSIRVFTRSHLKSTCVPRCQWFFDPVVQTRRRRTGYTSISDCTLRADNHGQPNGLWPIVLIAALCHRPCRPCCCDLWPALHSKQWADNRVYGVLPRWHLVWKASIYGHWRLNMQIKTVSRMSRNIVRTGQWLIPKIDVARAVVCLK